MRCSDRIDAAARRKIAAGATASPALARRRAVSALDAYRGVCFGALVFDLDGTLADAPAARADVRAALARLIEGGVQVAIATGRAPTDRALLLMRGLIGEPHHERVLIGYRNGAQLGRLDHDELETLSPLDPHDFAALRDLLAARLPAQDPDVLFVADTPAQITLRSTNSRLAAQPERLLAAAHEAIAATGARAKVLQSAQSIDIVHLRTSKDQVAARLGGESRPVLRIGDTGMHSGNDYELLAHAHGLSVEWVSSDLTGCWNFLPDGLRSVEGTLHYLDHLDVDGGGTAVFAERFFA